VTEAVDLYVTSLDRAGAAVATGATIGAAVSAIAALGGGNVDPLSVAGIAAVSFAASSGLIVVIGVPAWWLARRRGPLAAAATGALVGFILLLSAQTYGLGMWMPTEDGRTLAVRWVSALVIAAIAAVVGAGVALAMWLVAYRRL
jgi:hypothetical protein